MQGRGWRRRVRRIVIPGEIGVRYRPLLRRNNKATSTMKITTIGRNAVGSFGVGLFLLSTFPMFGQGTIASYRLGDNTGEDWEPAIVADGSYVYALSRFLRGNLHPSQRKRHGQYHQGLHVFPVVERWRSHVERRHNSPLPGEWLYGRRPARDWHQPPHLR